jgi:hypothetical protein
MFEYMPKYMQKVLTTMWQEELAARERLSIEYTDAPKKGPLQVGKNGIRYEHISGLWDGVDPSKYLPEEFDLVDLILPDGKVVKGWFNGKEWDGYKISGKEVKRWRRSL